MAVEIIDDGDCEQGERFYLSLESTDPLVSFPVNNAVVVIDGTTEYDDCGEPVDPHQTPHHILWST